jgi:hypothetical protein
MAVVQIFNAYTLSSGNAASAELTNVGNLTLQATVAGSTDNVEVSYVIKGKVGSGAYTEITHGTAIRFSTRGNQSFVIPVQGLECPFVKVYITVGNGSTGTLTLETIQSAMTVA